MSKRFFVMGFERDRYDTFVTVVDSKTGNHLGEWPQSQHGREQAQKQCDELNELALAASGKLRLAP